MHGLDSYIFLISLEKLSNLVLVTATSFGKMKILFSAPIFIVLLICGVQGLITKAEGLNDDQRDAFARFQEQALPILKKDFMKADGYLLRWIHAHNFDVKETLKKLRATLAWRAANGLDDILQEGDITAFDKDNELPYCVDGSVDKMGRPVVIAMVGLFDIRKITIAGRQDVYLRFLLHLAEILETYLLQQEKAQTNVTQAFGIMDLGGFSLRKSACISCATMFSDALQLLDSHYPNLYYKLYFINAPTVFGPVIKLVQTVISSSTFRTIETFDHDKDQWSKVLLREIAADQLPVQYGGSKEIGYNRAVWRAKTIQFAKGILQVNEIHLGNLNRTRGTSFLSSRPRPDATKINVRPRRRLRRNSSAVVGININAWIICVYSTFVLFVF